MYSLFGSYTSVGILGSLSNTAVSLMFPRTETRRSMPETPSDQFMNLHPGFGSAIRRAVFRYPYDPDPETEPSSASFGIPSTVNRATQAFPPNTAIGNLDFFVLSTSDIYSENSSESVFLSISVNSTPGSSARRLLALIFVNTVKDFT